MIKFLLAKSQLKIFAAENNYYVCKKSYEINFYLDIKGEIINCTIFNKINKRWYMYIAEKRLSFNYIVVLCLYYV